MKYCISIKKKTALGALGGFQGILCTFMNANIHSSYTCDGKKRFGIVNIHFTAVFYKNQKR